ncbi:MAG TPA: DJ-1/PfpI family protein [Clostridia bacterium]|nr:DJ-1/PfpI family protein [Clostridia bacterium]
MYNVGILLFDDIELLDFAGPFEVFSVTSELNNYELFNVFTVARNCEEKRSVNGLKNIPDYNFGNHPGIDILVIPGGVGSKTEMMKEDVLEWIYRNYSSSNITMSVCSGARFLGKLGLLDGLECTTHHEVMEHLKEIAPKAIINSTKRFTDNGRICTSAGISAGIDLSLHIVEKLYGIEVAGKTRAYMEYGDWEKYQPQITK